MTRKPLLILLCLFALSSVFATVLITTGQGSSGGYGLLTGTYMSSQNFSYTGGTGTYCLVNITTRNYRDVSGAENVTMNISIAYPNATNGPGGYESRIIGTNMTTYSITVTHTNYTFGFGNGITLNDSQMYEIIEGGNSTERGRVELATPSVVAGSWCYTGGSKTWDCTNTNYDVVYRIEGTTGNCTTGSNNNCNCPASAQNWSIGGCTLTSNCDIGGNTLIINTTSAYLSGANITGVTTITTPTNGAVLHIVGGVVRR